MKTHTAKSPDDFITRQLLRVAPFPIGDKLNGQFRLTLISAKGSSQRILITPEQFKKIERVLDGLL